MNYRVYSVTDDGGQDLLHETDDLGEAAASALAISEELGISWAAADLAVVKVEVRGPSRMELAVRVIRPGLRGSPESR